MLRSVAQRCALTVLGRATTLQSAPSRRPARPPLPRPLVESLEQRMLLAVNPIINEFMASNTDGIRDQDGDRPDWIELYNPNAASLNLDGYYLTNNANDLDQWRFPAVSIPAGGYLLVFASGKDRAVAGQELHTSFQLNANGEFLGLVAPDGATIVSAFNPQFPDQLPNVSYGLSTVIRTTDLLPAQVPLRVRIPQDNTLGSTWLQPSFNDSTWTSGKAGVGFETTQAPPDIPGFTIRMVDFGGGIGDIITAQAILNGPMPPGYSLQSDTSKDYAVVNTGSGGEYANDQLLPNGFTTSDEYALRATARVTIPAGTWSICVGSDDGFLLRIPGVTFFNRNGEEYTNVPGMRDDTLVYSSPRGHSPPPWGGGRTSGTFTVPAGGLKTTITLDMYENGGGDDVELSVASGQKTWDNSFVLLSDGVLPGWAVKTTSSAPPPDYTPLINTNVQAQMLNRNASAYIRIPLGFIENPNDFDLLRLRMKYDDGFIAYLNGQEIARRNAPPGEPAWNSAASGPHADAAALVFEDIDIAIPAGLLKVGSGTNVLAIQGLNESAAEGDFLIWPELQGVKILSQEPRYFLNPTPGAVNDISTVSEVVSDTVFSQDRGFYDTPFYVTISSATPGATIRYTLDGTDPTATSGTAYTGPILVSKTTTLRAAAFKTGAISSNVDTQTYLFTSDIIRQSPNGEVPPGWPSSWSPNTTDYGMDPDVVNNPQYSDEIEASLKAIPTFSIVTDLDNLFGPNGIYSNANNDGQLWERPASVELINPDGSRGFQLDGGIRIRGGYSRSTGNPKHAFRLFFNDDYEGKLHFPMFGPDAAQVFDKFDLRTAQNYSWSFDPGSGQGIFIRDQFARDTQLAMGMNATRGTYYHLYINGVYWGLYDTEERPEASFGESYYGGDRADYDVIKVDKDAGYTVYATNGNMEAWNDFWNQVNDPNIANNANYRRVQGLNPDGSRNPSYPVLLDVDNLIDYMLIIYYTGNFDAPLSQFLGNSSPNNFFAIRNRNGDMGFQYFAHDSEHTLFDVNMDRTGPFYQSNPIGQNKANPQTIFELLSRNAEFKLRVADRIHRYFFNNGSLTPAAVTARFTALRDKIFLPVVAESARWGDSKRSTPFTRDNEWINEINRILTSYIPYRTNNVINQFRADGLYTATAAPEFSQNGGEIPNPFNLSISNPGGAGILYYTLDGSDPRAFGGAKSPTALTYSAPIALTGTTTVKARVNNGGNWSALSEAVFYRSLSSLRVTELMYDPAAPPAGSPYTAQDFEYIELQNIGANPLDLTGIQFTYGIDYTFRNGASLAAGQRLVLARNAAAFASRYPGVALFDTWTATDSFNNGGERVRIVGPGGTIADFTYNNNWYGVTNGQGYSLVVVDPASSTSLSEKSAWRPGNALNGRPGATDPGYVDGAILMNEVMSNPAPGGADWIEFRNTTADAIDISDWFITNDVTNFTKYRLPSGSIVPGYGYLVLESSQLGFDLKATGDDIYLSSNDGDSRGGYREHIDFAAAAPEITFGRHVKTTGGADITALSAPTRGADNALPLVGPVVITEIHYNPAPGGHEFVELLNLTGSPVDLYNGSDASAWRFVEGINYAFGAGAQIPAFSYALVVPIEPDLFRSTYSVPANVPIYGPYVTATITKTLDDNGENLKLARPFPGVPDAWITIDQVHYDDRSPWPIAPDGSGPSLTRVNTTVYGNDATNWVAGPVNGTPGRPFVPPADPSDLVATPVSGSRIHLAWVDKSSNEEGFRIERATDGIHFTLLANVPADAVAYDDDTVSTGTFYSYRVQAFSAAGKSSFSNIAVATPLKTTLQSIFGRAANWDYRKGTSEASSPTTRWREIGFAEDATWTKNAPGPIGYDGAVPINTRLNDMRGGYMSVYMRKTFTIADPSAVSALRLEALYDDGFNAWINGTHVQGAGVSDNELAFDEPTNMAAREDDTYASFDLQNPARYLVAGTNVIAIHFSNVNLGGSSDAFFDASLSALVSTPQITADIVDVSPDPRAGSVGSISITFSEGVTGVTLDDFRLTRANGQNLLSAAQTVTAVTGSGNKTWTLNNLASITAAPGEYTLRLTAAGSNIVGSATGNILGADATDTFTVTPPSLIGTPGADTFYLRLNGANIEVFTAVPPAGNPVYSWPAASLTDLPINTGDGDDLLELGTALSIPLNLTLGGGTDRLVIDSGTHTFPTNLGGFPGIEEVIVNDGSRVTFEASQQLNYLKLADSSRATLAAQGDRFLRLSKLEIASKAALDLADNDMVFQSTAASRAADLAALTGWVTTGRGATGAWTGRGITSSAAAGDASRLTALGILLNDRGNNTPIHESFATQAVDANSILLRYTWCGDADLTGNVDADDYFRIDRGRMLGLSAWRDGNFNYTDGIGADDYQLIDAAFLQNKSLGAPAFSRTAIPSSLAAAPAPSKAKHTAPANKKKNPAARRPTLPPKARAFPAPAHAAAPRKLR